MTVSRVHGHRAAGWCERLSQRHRGRSTSRRANRTGSKFTLDFMNAVDLNLMWTLVSVRCSQLRAYACVPETVLTFSDASRRPAGGLEREFRCTCPDALASS